MNSRPNQSPESSPSPAGSASPVPGSTATAVADGTGSGSGTGVGNATGAAGGTAAATQASVPASGGKQSFVGKRVGRFRLMSLLGQGTMGRVFRAEDVDLHRHVALKVIADKSVGGRRPSDRVEQFAREARSAARLEHPHVVTVYEVGRVGEVHYIAMELVEGGNLYDLLKAGGPMDAVRACLLCAEAAEALQYAHENGVLHRDVKPANLMLARGGRCKLADFGLARIDDPNDSFALQQAGVGTPLYAAPEMIRHEPATARSDVYSLGASLYHLLAGAPPFTAPSASEVMRRHLTDPVPDLLDRRPDLPSSLADVVRKAMAKDPADRYESAGKMAAVLRMHTVPVGGSFGGTVVVGSGVTAGTGSLGLVSAGGSGSSSSLPPQASGGPRIGRRTAVLAAVVALVVVGATIAFFVTRGDDRGKGVVVVPSAQPQSTSPLTPTPVPADPGPPTPAPVPPARTPSRGPVVPAGELDVADTVSLNAIAHEVDPRHADPVTVVGVVRSVELSPTGKIYYVNFEGVGRDGLFGAFFPSYAKDLAKAFPGAGDVPAWVGKRIHLRGDVSLYQDRPEILIKSPSQVKVDK